MLLTHRNQLPAFLTTRNLTTLGVELGVARGAFSEQLLKNSPLRCLYSIDAWAGDRGHDLAECEAATRRLSRFNTVASPGEAAPEIRSIVLRARFEEALPLFDDASLDFVYVDGYAHEGNESGKTLSSWWQKIKPGGMFAGHDYHPDHWPKNVAAVDAFTASIPGQIEEFFITKADKFPSWVIVKA